MDELDNTLKNILARYGYELKSFNIISKAYDNTIIVAKCKQKDVVIKMFSNEQIHNIPNIGDPEDRFIGSWYVQSRISQNLENTVPNVIGSEFSKSRNFYIMDKIQYNDNHNWSNNMYLIQMCQDIGSRLSDIHQISNNLIGGIPGKNSDPMINMRRYIKKVESNIKETKYRKYQNDLSELAEIYEEIYEPNNKWIIHGDIEPSNILTDDSGLVKSVIDWDNSMYGDPLLDIAMCHTNICDIYSNRSPWDTDTVRNSVTESYQHAVNPKRLNILRSMVSLNRAAKLAHPHRKVNNDINNRDLESIHIDSFNSIINTIK